MTYLASSSRFVLLALIAAYAATASPATAQEYLRVDGTVQWLTGQTLVLMLDVPAGPPSYVIQGPYLVPVPAPRQMVTVDLSQLPQSEYAFMRSGERVAVIGTVSDDRRRLIATSIIRGPGQQAP